MKLPTERIAWIDVLKGLGIYLIYVVHLPGNTGNFNLFFMIFAVPLFFFAGGLTAQRSKERSFRVFLRDKTQKILIPYFAFGLLTMAVRMIVLPESKLGELIGWTKQLALGRRNNLFAASLWFLPCYFCVTLLYHGLQKVLKNQWLLLGVCTVLSLAVRFSIDAPLLLWGLDSAVRYLFYYALGDALMTPIERVRNDGMSRGGKLIFAAVTGSVLWLNLLNYLYGRGYIPGLFGVTLDFNGQVIELIGMALVGLYAVVLLSLVLEGLPGLARLGGVSLVLCCAESMVKLMVPVAFEVLGLTLHYESPMQGLLCSAVFVAVAYWCVAKPVQRYFPFMIGQFKTKTQQERIL